MAVIMLDQKKEKNGSVKRRKICRLMQFYHTSYVYNTNLLLCLCKHTNSFLLCDFSGLTKDL